MFINNLITYLWTIQQTNCNNIYILAGFDFDSTIDNFKFMQDRPPTVNIAGGSIFGTRDQFLKGMKSSNESLESTIDLKIQKLFSIFWKTWWEKKQKSLKSSVSDQLKNKIFIISDIILQKIQLSNK